MHEFYVGGSKNIRDSRSKIHTLFYAPHGDGTLAEAKPYKSVRLLTRVSPYHTGYT